MAPDQSLEEWVQEKYNDFGTDKKANFIGKKLFKNKLISFYGSTKSVQALSEKSRREKLDEIRRIVNAGGYLPSGATAIKALPSTATVPPSSYRPSSSKDNPSGSTANSSLASKAKGSSSTARAPVQPSNAEAEVNNQIPTDSKTNNSTAKIPSQKFDKKVDASSSKQGKDNTALQPTVSANLRSKSDRGIDKGPVKDDNAFNRILNLMSGSVSHFQRNELPRTLDINHVQVPVHSKIQELIDDTEKPLVHNSEGPSETEQIQKIPIIEHQLRLLDLSNGSESSKWAEIVDSDIRNAVILSTEVLRRCNTNLTPQYALLGSVCPAKEFIATESTDPRLFLNVNVPFSAFICGLQGSGKSHTLSCILENSLIKNPILGVLQRPLSALVFHFGQYTSMSSFRPCEAAFLAYRHPNFPEYAGVSSVNVMVAPSNYHNLNDSYSHIPGVKVRPFKLRSKDLNIGSMLTLMSVDQSEATPLYLSQITKILRELATASRGEFDYKKFKAAIQSCTFSISQKGPLEQRLDILESFLDLDDSTADLGFEAGSITIVDLSCPFVDANTACVIFNICISMYLASTPTVGKLIAIDEAHKFMTNTPASKALTESLLTVIRQQRHFGARVIISTQEPTISPRLMDLCSVIIIHRFSSPEWFEVVRKHISVGETDKAGLESLFERIVKLRVGEALIYAPSTITTMREQNHDVLVQLSSNLLKAKIRSRLTWDGGKSVLCL